MHIIRKISIGPDQKGGAMAFQVDNKCYPGIIKHILDEGESYAIYAKTPDGETVKWKEVNKHLPIVVEYNTEFDEESI